MPSQELVKDMEPTIKIILRWTAKTTLQICSCHHYTLSLKEMYKKF